MNKLILILMTVISIPSYANFKRPHCEKVVLSYAKNYNEILELEKKLSGSNSYNIALQIENKERDLIHAAIELERLCSVEKE